MSMSLALANKISGFDQKPREVMLCKPTRTRHFYSHSIMRGAAKCNFRCPSPRFFCPSSSSSSKAEPCLPAHRKLLLTCNTSGYKLIPLCPFSTNPIVPESSRQKGSTFSNFLGFLYFLRSETRSESSNPEGQEQPPVLSFSCKKTDSDRIQDVRSHSMLCFI